MNYFLMVFHRIVLGIICLTFLIPIGLILMFYVGNYFGLHCKGASHYYFEAIKEGNGPETVYWAKRVLFYTKDDRWTNLSEKLTEIAKAYKLNNEQNQSQKICEEIEEIDGLFSQGKVKEANQRIIEVRLRVINE